MDSIKERNQQNVKLNNSKMICLSQFMLKVFVNVTPTNIFQRMRILWSPSFSSVLKKQWERASFILLGIVLHLDKCNTAGRTPLDKLSKV